MNHKISNLLLSAAMALTSILPSAAADNADVRTSTNRVIYEVFVRNFSSDGNLAGVTAQIPRLKELGVDVLWLMPIYSPGLTDRWGTYASPYAVRDYTGIDPDYGTASDLKTLVTTAHNNGMEIWLDWVANHTSTDNVWVSSHPEYYGSSFTHPFNWSDVYQLDYSNSGLRTAMIDALKYWVTEFDIDGYRCDYAEGVARDFWSQARTAVNAIKDITWLAESGGEGDAALLVKETFDYNYAWAYNDALLAIGSGIDVSTLATQSYNLHYPSDAANYTGKSRMVYLSNHDVVQDKGGTEDRHFGDNLKPMTVLEFTIYGMPLIYNGQEVKYSSAAVSLAEKTPINWNGDSSMTELITKLCNLKHTQPALRTGSESGDLINHTASNSSVYVYERRNSTQSVVVMLNFGSDAASFNVTSSLPSNTFKDVFTNTTVNFASTKSFTLPAHGYAVYVMADDEPLVSNDITITLRRPSFWTNTPNVHLYYTDSTGKDITVIDNQQMTAVAGSSDLFTYVLHNPVDGYNVMFNNGGWANGQSEAYYEETAGNYTYTINSDLSVSRADDSTGSDDSSSTVEPSTNQITITLRRPSFWSNTPNVHLYYTDSTGTDITLIDNQQMTAVAGSSDLFTYVLENPVDGYNVMFNNGGWANGQSGAYYEETAGNYTYTVNSDLSVSRDGDSTGSDDSSSTVEPTTNQITITLRRPSFWSNTPNVHLYYTDSTGTDITVIDNQQMTAVAGSSDLFTYVLENPVDGYNVMFNNGGWANGQSDTYYEETAGNYTYTVNSDLSVSRADDSTGSDDSSSTVEPSTNQITITLRRPSFWSNTPNVHLYYTDSTGTDITVIDNQQMTAVAGSSDLFTYVLHNPVDGYNVMFNNGGWANGQSEAYYEETAGNYTYTINSDLSVSRADDSTDSDDSSSTVEPTPSQITITLRRPNFWSNTPNVHLYYTDSTGSDITLIDNQQMTAVDGSYDLFTYVLENPVDGYTVMFNNGGWSNGQTNGYYEAVAGNYTYGISSDYTLVRDGDQVDTNYYLYIDNQTGWGSNLTIYGWASGLSELYGGWPGTSTTFTKVVDGVTYSGVAFPESSKGQTYNLILSNSGSSQLGDYVATIDGDVYIKATTSGVSRVSVATTALTVAVPETEMKTRYYNMQGIEVCDTDLVPGLYLKKTGNKVSKVIIR